MIGAGGDHDVMPLLDRLGFSFSPGQIKIASDNAMPPWWILCILVLALMSAGTRTMPRASIRLGLASILAPLAVVLPFAGVLDMRYACLASIFLCILLGAAAAPLWRRPWGRALCAALMTCWAYQTYDICRWHRQHRAMAGQACSVIEEQLCASRRPYLTDSVRQAYSLLAARGFDKRQLALLLGDRCGERLRKAFGTGARVGGNGPSADPGRSSAWAGSTAEGRYN